MWKSYLKIIIDLSIQDIVDISIYLMRILYHVTHCYTIRLKLGDNFLTSLTKLVLQVKARICSTIKENLLLYCGEFLTFAVIVIIQDIFL